MKLKSIKKIIKEIDASNMKPSSPGVAVPPAGSGEPAANKRKEQRITDTQFPDLEQTLENSTKNNPYIVTLPSGLFLYYKEGTKVQMTHIKTKIPPPDHAFNSVGEAMQNIENMMTGQGAGRSGPQDRKSPYSSLKNTLP